VQCLNNTHTRANHKKGTSEHTIRLSCIDLQSDKTTR